MAFKPHIVIMHEHLARPKAKRNRTTSYLFYASGIKIVLWRKKYRPKKERLFCTDEQIASARRYLETFNN